ncbi:cyclic nucleotide-binding protein-like protein [Leptomonas seymouri]|uniref:Cyclic nucleotide-binding protein-like protein n=1 Tax=Leptomonas seymouri TaxID=5684 RepID=A0A0N1PAZ4_LEPSE|nr:cyclic nucleotide-binding protein-like protein [Leptomonas seymouri]|eukprot:KPI84408.1 cyclic nucleotide-binding protein-like protein [Leptomonas seymouri]
MDHTRNYTFLTDVEAGGDAQKTPASAATAFSAAEDAPGPLSLFRVPPMPKSVVSRRYVSLDHVSPYAGSHHLPEWERQMILARLRKSSPIDEEEFQRRLGSAKMRNGQEYLRQVCGNAARQEEERSMSIEAAFVRDEQRRQAILYRYRHALEIRRAENFFARAKKWYTIVVCHAFISALMQECRVQNALGTFSFLMAPMIKRYLVLRRKRAEAAELTRQHLRDIPFPSPQVIESMHGTFFEGWPAHLLEKLVEKAKPYYLRKGSYLMHEGDVGRVMFMITTGTVSIILRKRGPDKRRTKDNSSGVLQIKAPCYVGEFALVCKEPRSASILCETDVGYWAVLPQNYEEVAKHLSADVASKQREATDVRRRQNLQRFFPLHADFLRKFSYFKVFSDEGLAKLIDSVEPIVLHNGDFLFKEGELDSSAYFLQDGVAVMRDHNGNDFTVPKGDCIGVFECCCGVNEPKRTSLVSVNYSDIWRLKRDVLTEVGMSEPAALLHCRNAAKKDRASQIPMDKSVLWGFKKDPYMMFCCPANVLTRLFEKGTPTMFLNGERLALMGQNLNALVFVVNGMLDITMARNGTQTTFRTSITPNSLNDMAQMKLCASFRGLSRVIGAYEFASCLTQYVCTVSSFGLTEAVVIDRTQIEAILSPQLRVFMNNDARAKEIVLRAYMQQNAGLLYSEQQFSFLQDYKGLKLAPT